MFIRVYMGIVMYLYLPYTLFTICIHIKRVRVDMNEFVYGVVAYEYCFSVYMYVHVYVYISVRLQHTYQRVRANMNEFVHDVVASVHPLSVCMYVHVCVYICIFIFVCLQTHARLRAWCLCLFVTSLFI